MYYSLPLFSFNVALWRFLGFIEFKRIEKVIFLIAIPLIVNIGQFLNIVQNYQDMNVIAIGLFMTTILFNALVRILFVMKNQWKFIQLLETIENWYNEIEVLDRCMPLKDEEHLEVTFIIFRWAMMQGLGIF